MAARGADVEDALQVKAPKEMRLSVNVLMMKGLVTVKVLLVKVMVKVFVLEVVVKVFVVEVEEVFLSSLSSTSFPRTRPAARVWASGAKGLGLQFAAPAPGRRCSGPFS